MAEDQHAEVRVKDLTQRPSTTRDAAEPSLEAMLARIASCATLPSYDDTGRSLLHAYVACLSIDDLCASILLTLTGQTAVRSALRSRILRLARSGHEVAQPLTELTRSLLNIVPRDAKARSSVDAVLSHIYAHLPLLSRHEVLEHWLRQGRRSAEKRWLKAVAGDETLFDAATIAAYWQASRDPQAAKVLATQAAPETLVTLLPELVRHVDEGWIVGKAMQRAGKVQPAEWAYVRKVFPATFTYLCAKLHLPLSEVEALALISASSEESSFGARGLAIWATGQLGLRNALDILFAEATQRHVTG